MAGVKDDYSLEDLLNADGSPFNCHECATTFKNYEELLGHLRRHIKQPKVILERINLQPLKLTIKNTNGSGFQVVSSPLMPSPKMDIEVEKNCPTSDITITPVVTQENTEDNADSELSHDEFTLEIETDGTISNTEETTPEEDMITGVNYDANRQPEIIPGGEPTPPPDTPELPKIRIKTGLLQPKYQEQKDRANSNEAMVEIITPGSKESEKDNMLSRLFTNNDRAKDLGFTTIDPDFNPADIPQGGAIQPYGQNNNPLATLHNLPMQHLAQQVSRLQPNSNGLHQQNVLINIQQFQPPPQPPHPYQPPIYQQPQQPPPPAYRPPPPPQMQYPYPPNVYYPPYPQHPHHQQHPQQYMPQHPQIQQPPMPPQNPMRPPSQMQPPTQMQNPHMARPPHQMQQFRQQRPQNPRPAMGNHMNQQHRPQLRMQMPQSQQARMRNPPARMPILQQTLKSAPLSGKTKQPQPNQHQQPQNQQMQRPGVANNKRQPIDKNVKNAKKPRMDTLVPDKNDDADCEVVALTQKNDSLPQIQRIQGNVNDTNSMQLSNSISLSINTKPKEPENEAKEVANVLAARGITVTKTPKAKETHESQVSPVSYSNGSVSINLNSSVCIIPKKKDEETVDLTDENDASKTNVQGETMKPPPPPPPNGKSQVFECHLCASKFYTTAMLIKHRKMYHRTNIGPEFGIPLIDLKQPGITQRLKNYGIYHYIPLPNSNPNMMFALPILSPTSGDSTKNANSQDFSSHLLSLGPIKPINDSSSAKPVQKTNNAKK